jgi:hypothetical protein
MLRRTILLILALAAVGISIPLSAQSLADVAKKEEDRRKDIKAPSKVLTNKDLADVPPATAAPAASSPSGSTSDQDKDKGAEGSDAAKTKDKDAAKDKDKDKDKDAPVKDEKYWSTKIKALRDALAHDQVLADAMQTQINSLTTDFVNRDDPAQRAVIDRNRQTAVAELNRLKEQIKNDQKAIDELQEDARRAGVPPGWLR